MPGQLDVNLSSSNFPIFLRVPNIEDFQELFDILNDPLNTEFDPYVNKGTIPINNIQSMINRMRISASLDIPDRLNLVLVDKSFNNKVIGLSGFGYIGTENNKRIGDVGIMINSNFRGKGHALESIKLLIDYGFNVLKLNEITATMLEKNIPMRNLLEEKLKIKGIIRESKIGNECFYQLNMNII